MTEAPSSELEMLMSELAPGGPAVMDTNGGLISCVAVPLAEIVGFTVVSKTPSYRHHKSGLLVLGA